MKRFLIFSLVLTMLLTCLIGCEHVHQWESATCRTPKTCSTCGAISGTANGHTLSDAITIQELTCGQDGIEEAVCSVCNETVTTTSSATGDHTVDNWDIIQNATCTQEGSQEAVCTICNVTLCEPIAKAAHEDDEEWVILTAPTLLTSGEKATHCVNCGAVMQTESFTLNIEEINAVKSAENYLDFMAFSRSGLIKQLEFEGYSKDAATLAVDLLDVDWNEQAAKCAQNYIDFMSFSKSSLISQLEYEGFTREQAEYGVKAVGY